MVGFAQADAIFQIVALKRVGTEVDVVQPSAQRAERQFDFPCDSHIEQRGERRPPDPLVDQNNTVTDSELKTSIRVSGAKIPFKIIDLRVTH